MIPLIWDTEKVLAGSITVEKLGKGGQDVAQHIWAET